MLRGATPTLRELRRPIQLFHVQSLSPMQSARIQSFDCFVIVVNCFLAITATSCNRSTDQLFTVEQGRVTHVDGCNIMVHGIQEWRGIRRVRVQYACGVAPATIHDAKWWGDQPQPLMFSVDLGDCMLMQETYYCMEDFIDRGSVTFRAMYKKPKHPLGNLERIR